METRDRGGGKGWGGHYVSRGVFSISVVVIVVLFGTNVQYWDRPGTPIEVLVGQYEKEWCTHQVLMTIHMENEREISSCVLVRGKQAKCVQIGW